LEYKEIYNGKSIIITTLQQADGWKSKAELLDSEKRVSLWIGSDERYCSEEARMAALSIAAGAIDRSQITRGKPLVL